MQRRTATAKTASKPIVGGKVEAPAEKNYITPPGRLEDDPVYRRHPQDWQVWHTRYIAPDRFRHALLPDPPSAPPGPTALTSASAH